MVQLEIDLLPIETPTSIFHCARYCRTIPHINDGECLGWSWINLPMLLSKAKANHCSGRAIN